MPRFERSNSNNRQPVPLCSVCDLVTAHGESLLQNLFKWRLDAVERGMNVLALVKGSERYVFLYDDDSVRSLLQTLGRYAADPELTFTWYDAAILSQKVRRLRDEQPQRLPAQRFPKAS